jgi:hypothetical protein
VNAKLGFVRNDKQEASETAIVQRKERERE